MRNFDCWVNQREQAEIIECGLKVFKGENNSDKPTLYMWKPKATNPYVKYYFNSEERRESYLEKEIEKYLVHLQSKKEYKAAEKAKPLCDIVAGDIFYTSWGYDQTNYDFIIIDKISDTGKTCICRMAKAPRLMSAGQCDVLRPIHSGYGKTFRMTITSRGIKGSYYYCGESSDSKHMGWFWKHSAGTRYNQTNPAFGH